MQRVAVVGLLVGMTVAGWATAPGRAEEAPRGGWLMGLRTDRASPAGVMLVAAGSQERSWLLGLDLAPGLQRPTGAWAGSSWALGPDALARVSLRLGYELAIPDGGEGRAGPWVGVWLGQQWFRRPLMAQLGTELRVAVGSWRSPSWATGMAVGLAW
ncbi:hypothetical protein [Geochorda subterranea]|uniref:Outer membrane protein with beta-barrel domain n=1 Tax=Geochorda subterranea TaxID=3109564 RepID=A0ABZ1BRT4_9FIRM|nr:hypothetical protein [Limnochorda sp. LNt]WRP15521.1 hypothetical protein VLY81_04980 [Limnochorda sp. LNt]